MSKYFCFLFVLMATSICAQEKVIIVNKMYDESFCINGYTFPKNSDFSVELGDRYVLVNEEKEIVDGGHRMHYEIKNLDGTTRHYITSKIVRTEIEIIADAAEVSRKIYKTYSWMSERDYWTATLRYTITLSDSSKYTLFLSFNLIESEAAAIDRCNNFKIEKGDHIFFNNSFIDSATIIDKYGNYKTTGQVNRSYDKIFEKYSETGSYKVTLIMDSWPYIGIKFEDFANNYSFYLVSKKKIREETRLEGKLLKYVDRYKIDRKTYYQFIDDEGNIVTVRTR